MNVHPLEVYLKSMRRIHATGEAVEETSYYAALSNLLDEVGKALTPKVRCVLTISDRGAGIPDGLPLAHKHGFATDTHADAGIVYSEGASYILVQFQYAPTDWLVWAISQPVFEDVSFANFNFFNVAVE